ncbi:hypothetical protein ACIHCM_05755 [Streptomyces sp. NPDC052023]|uniref:hypothetical protein n=1 Tax=Streptomyces sp. NPDC052023 TaxID=3365681 RepID=UPI0037CDDC82
MTPRWRVRRAAGVVLGLALSTVVLACEAVASYETAGPSFAGRRTDDVPSIAGERSGPPSPSPSLSGPVDPSWAGSRAGEGRMRPGRPEEPGTQTAHPSGTGAADDVTASPPSSAPGAAEDEDVQAVNGADPSGPVLRVLPLGSGLVLIGLGFGLAFVALRVRRVRE